MTLDPPLAVCMPLQADLHAVFAACSRHLGRTMPVVSADGPCAGPLAREDVQVLRPGETLR